MGPSLSSTFTQLFPPKPAFTEKNVENLEGKVFLVTGANTGVGKDLARLLYSKNGKVYIAARSEEKGKIAIEDIKRAEPTSKGALMFFKLDLNDLTAVKASATEFLSLESKLHVLVNNAGVQSANGQAKTVQGYEKNLGVNCLGTFLFTKLLTPLLVSTAKSERPGVARVVWVSSNMDLAGAKDTGVLLENLDYHEDKPALLKYGYSKAGDYLYSVEYARRYKEHGVISVSLNPGNLWSELYRDQSSMLKFVVKHILSYPTLYGAYTELYAGVSANITLENSGCWVVPFGRIRPIREDWNKVKMSTENGGNGAAEKFWNWSEDQIAKYT